MAFSFLRRSGALAGAALLLTTLPALVSAIDLNLCSTINTSDNQRNISEYQTNGLCTEFCTPQFAYAITQYNACWCSNYTPAESVQESVSDCSTPCPAYPDEKCGGQGLYGYVELIAALPSGTKGGEEEQPSSTSTTSTRTTAQSTSTTSTSSSTSSDEETTSTEETSTREETSTEESTSTRAPPPPATTQTMTEGDVVRTVTITPTQAPAPTGDAEGGTAGSTTGDDNSGGGLSSGATAGIAVGVVGAVLIAAALGLFFFFRRRKQNKANGYDEDPSVRGSSPGRSPSGHVEMSMAGGTVQTPNSASNRNSMLQIDPRMDPFKQGLYGRNGSHESINTLRDDHDYSRRILRATNPDGE